MELYNEERGKLRKKDKTAYYYDKQKKFVQVPNMSSDKETIYNFLKFCVSIKHPEVSEKDIRDVWETLEENKPLILDAMEELKREAEATGADIWKVRSYDKAIKTLNTINVPIASGAQAIKLPGIGKGMAGVISEVLKHGRLKTQEERMEAAIERESTTEIFMKLWDVNKKTADMWYNFGHRSVEDLSKDEKLKLTERQRLGIKYYEELQRPIDRKYLDMISKILSDFDPTLVGSARRDESTKVAEYVICVPKIGKPVTKKVVDTIKSDKKIKVHEAHLDAKQFSGILEVSKGHIFRIEIYMTVQDDCGPVLVQKTGPETFVNFLKEQAAVMGYGFGTKKSQGLVKFSENPDDDDEKIPVPTEKELFEILNMKYMKPEDRT